MKLNVTTYPDPVLRKIAEPVTEVTDELLEFVEKMGITMYEDDGVGLAAPQVGVSKRIIVVDAGQGFHAVFNPEISYPDEHEIESLEEGCLSLPGIHVDVKRPTRIILKGMNENGESFEHNYEGMMARVFQHETDHLNGRMIIDYASTLQNALLKKKLKNLEKKSEN